MMWNELQDPFEVKKAKYLNSIEMEGGSFFLKGRMVAILGSLCGLCGLCPCRVESSHRPYIIHKGPACAPTTLFMHTGIRISNFFLYVTKYSFSSLPLHSQTIYKYKNISWLAGHTKIRGQVGFGQWSTWGQSKGRWRGWGGSEDRHLAARDKGPE